MKQYRFYNYKTYQAFLRDFDNIPKDAIVFIQDKLRIWTHGKEYVCDGPYTTDVDDNTLTFKNSLDDEILKVSYKNGLLRFENSDGQIDVQVDSQLNLTSTNPVQNKVIAEALNNKVDASTLEEYAKLTDVPENCVTKLELSAGLAGKQNTLTAGNGISIQGSEISVTLDGRLDDVEEKIPSTASSINLLADKEFVNSSISTSTATFRGTSTTGLTEAQFLEWANGLTKDANDYVFWNTVDSAGTPLFKRYKYNGTAWMYEYTLNNSSFTAEQWATINSLLTSSHKNKLDALPTNAELNTLFEDKQDVINDLTTIRNGAAAGATAYQKPSAGIPSSDMTSAVQASLDKADTAIQSSDLATVATSGNYNDLNNKPAIPVVPTNVSAFDNDAKYVKQENLENFLDVTSTTGHTISGELILNGGASIPSFEKLEILGDVESVKGFKKKDSSNDYVLLAGGGTKALSEIMPSEFSGVTLDTKQTITGEKWFSGNVSFLYDSFITVYNSIKVGEGDSYTWIEPWRIELSHVISPAPRRTAETILDAEGITSPQFIVDGGTSSQFLKADGSVDSNTYITSASLSGYATQSWVTTQLGDYLPLTGGTITGDMTVYGNVGIGIASSSSYKLHVGGTFYASGDSTFGSNLNLKGGIIYGATGLELNSYGAHSSSGGFIDFHFNGSSSDYTSRIIEDANGRLKINTSLYVLTSGNVGVGTSSPSYKLDVNGSLNATSIYENGTLLSSTYLPKQGSSFYFITDADMPEKAANISTLNATHRMTLYRNAILMPYQMNDANDGGFIRSRGTSESSAIFEIGMWDDSGAGETIQFNYYPTTSTINPTYSVTVPKKSGTIALTNDFKTINGNSIIGSGDIVISGGLPYLPLTGGTITGDLTIKNSSGAFSTLYIIDGYGYYTHRIVADGDGLNIYSKNDIYFNAVGDFYFVDKNVAVGTYATSYKLTVGGQVGATGFVNTSDLRKKTITGDVPMNLYNVANAPLFRFTWKDDNNNIVHIGSAAQYWQTILPELVSIGRDADMTLAMQYDVIALASAITVAKTVVNHEERIILLERENEALKKEIADLKSALR